MERIRQMINVYGRTVLLILLLVLSVGCDDGEVPTSETDTDEVKIVEDTVEDMPQGFNGGKGHKKGDTKTKKGKKGGRP